MLGLPKSTELYKPIFKKAVFEKFNFNTKEKEYFDKSIKQLHVVGEISSKTVQLQPTDAVQGIFVLQVTLKNKDCDDKLLIKIAKLIDRKMVLVLKFEQEIQLAIFHSERLQRGEWKLSDEQLLRLQGLDLSMVWENFVVQIGNVQIQEGNTLDEQLDINDKKSALEKEIAAITKKMWSAKQPKQKLELRKRLNSLKQELNCMR